MDCADMKKMKLCEGKMCDKNIKITCKDENKNDTALINCLQTAPTTIKPHIIQDTMFYKTLDFDCNSCKLCANDVSE